MTNAMRVHQVIGAVASLLLGCNSQEPEVATQLRFGTQPPAAATSMQPLGTVTVEARTPSDHVATDATGNVEIALVSTDTAAHLTGTTTAAFVSGVATFSNLLVDKAGASYRLVARLAGFSDTESSTFSINVGTAAALLITPLQPPLVGAGKTFSVSVRVVDAGGNAVMSATPSVAISSSPDQLLGTKTVGAIAGTATFADLSIQKSGGYTLTASATGLSSGTSTLSIQSGPCTQVTFFTQPTDTKVSTAIPNFSVFCGDQYGNPPLPPGGSTTATVVLGNNPGGATLSGNTNASGFNASIQFSGLSLDKVGNGYTLVVSIPGRASGTSAPFNIIP